MYKHALNIHDDSANILVNFFFNNVLIQNLIFGIFKLLRCFVLLKKYSAREKNFCYSIGQQNNFPENIVMSNSKSVF